MDYGLIRSVEKRTDKINEITQNKGCNVILDCISASEFENVWTYIIIEY